MGNRRVAVLLGLLLLLACLWWLVGRDDGVADVIGSRDERVDGGGPMLSSRAEDAPTGASAVGEVGAKPDPRPLAFASPLVLDAEVRVVWAAFSSSPIVWSGERRRSDLEGATVRVLLVREGIEAEELARVALDAHGRLSVELPQIAALSPLERSGALLAVRSPDGYVTAGPTRFPAWDTGSGRWYLERIPLPGLLPPDGRFRLLLPVLRLSVIGRVIDEDGSPVVDAFVQPLRLGSGSASAACTDADGRFALSVGEGGRFNVIVRVKDGRTAERLDVFLASDGTSDLGDVVVRGSGRGLSGRVTWPDGSAVAGAVVVASVVGGSSRGRWMDRLPCEPRGDSLVTTADEGGRYVVYPERIGGGRSWAVRPGFQRLEIPFDAPGPQSALDDGNDIVIHAHRLRISVVDEDERPVHGAMVRLRRLPADGEFDRGPIESQRIAGAGETAGVWLPLGSTWRVEAWTDGSTVDVEDFQVPAEANESVLRMQIAAVDFRSGIRVALRGPDDRSLLPASVAITDADGGRTVWTGRANPGEPGIAVPPGRYRVRLTSMEQVAGGLRWEPAVGEVAVGAEEVQAVSLRTTAFARVRITVRAPGRTQGDRTDWAVRLERDGQEPLAFDVSPNQEIGRRVPPGAWQVTLEADGVHEVSKHVELRADEETLIELEAERR